MSPSATNDRGVIALPTHRIIKLNRITASPHAQEHRSCAFLFLSIYPHPNVGFTKPHIYTSEMELWHALNRGVDGRDLFLDSRDCIRFVHNLYQFNDRAPATELPRRRSPDSANVGFRKSHTREKLVDIHGWVLVKNHYHLLLSERVEGGISLFLRKVNVGYANYFNERYGRKGTLFQGRTKKILIEREAHFLYILHYLHLNPLDYLEGTENWRVRSKNGIKNMKEALEYLDSYRWSSYLDYSGKKNFPSILTTSFFKEALGDPHKSLIEYLKDAELDKADLSKLVLE
ncbi:MAG: hypothetical protein WCW36_01195 [Candidatus Paceibacterota bacterium]|jgi:putative transposase